jgi:predicted  nucleic acid-binding Zn-ribbon protein
MLKLLPERQAMDVKDYCRNVNAELTAWKAKLYDVIRQMDKLSTGDKQRMYEQINGLHIVMTELEDRLDQLRTACPTEWAPERKKIKKKIDDLGSKYEKTTQEFFDYEVGG